MKPNKQVQAVVERARAGRDANGSYYMATKDVAVLVRERLKREFPGVRFSVRSSVYSGGSSVYVGWTDGPKWKDVQAILSEYRSSTFDGMIDMAVSVGRWLLPDGTMAFAECRGTVGSMGTIEAGASDCPQPGAVLVRGGADYVDGQRDTSDEYDIALAAEVLARFCGPEVCVPLDSRGRVEDIRVETGYGSEYLRTLMHRHDNRTEEEAAV